MGATVWFLLLGALLLAVGFATSRMRRLPVTTAILYLGVGLLFGPTVLGTYHFNPLQQSVLLERLTEVAVLISLFSAGLKMPVPVSAPRWRLPVLLAFGAMALTAALMTAFGHFALGLPLGAAVLLAGILAPTDPVLATDVQIRHPGDRDRLRFGLTCEAGMNDGSAFPVVMLGLGLLGLHELGEFGTRWVLVDLIWATVGGIALGIAVGGGLGAVIQRMAVGRGNDHLMDDFIGLGAIALVYGVSLLIHVWGFLAVFAAAVALRQAESRYTGRRDDELRLRTADGDDDERFQPLATKPTVAERSLAFKEQLERLSEVVLVLLIGGTLFLDSWSLRAIATAAFLFLVARPVAVLLFTLGSPTPWHLRGMTAWFGVRGIGTLYYLMYAIQHGLPEPLALELIHITLIVVTLSILVHGVSVKPLLAHFDRGVNARRRRPMAASRRDRPSDASADQ